MALALIRGERSAKIHRQHHVFGDGKSWEQLEELEYEADAAAAPAGELVLLQILDFRAVHGYGTVRRAIDAADHVEES